MLQLLCLMALLATAISDQIEFNDCLNEEIMSVSISNCYGTRCSLRRGQMVTVEVEFRSNQDTPTAQLDVVAQVGATEIRIPNIERNACRRLPCPLKQNEVYKLSYTMKVPRTAPTVAAQLKAKLRGAQGMLACGSVRGKIVK